MTNQPRVAIESLFSVERWPLSRGATEISSQSGYLLVCCTDLLPPTPSDPVCQFLNPNQSLRLAAARHPRELLLIRLTPQLLIETAARLRLHPAGAHLLFRHSLTPITEDAKLSATLQVMREEMTEAAAGWREVIASLVNQLAIHLLRWHVNVQRSDEVELSRVGMVDRRLRRAIEFMHDNCQRELALAEISSAAYLSAFHFARLFKKITGITPHAYLATLRIEKARRLLAESDLSISEIGAQVGYASQSHFTRIFREATGLTPRAFRQAAQGKIS